MTSRYLALYIKASTDIPNSDWRFFNSTKAMSWRFSPIDWKKVCLGIKTSLAKILQYCSSIFSSMSSGKWSNAWPNSWSAVKRLRSVLICLLMTMTGVPFSNVPLRPEKASEASTSTTMIPLVSKILMTFVIAALPIFQSVRSLVAALKTSFKDFTWQVKEEASKCLSIPQMSSISLMRSMVSSTMRLIDFSSLALRRVSLR